MENQNNTNHEWIGSGIRCQVIEELCNLADRYDIQRIVLFGSRARGDYGRASDIDLAVWGGETALFRVAAEEETSTLLKFDVVDMNREPQRSLEEVIEREGVVVYEKV